MADSETRANRFDEFRQAAADAAENIENEAKAIGDDLKGYFGATAERACSFVKERPITSLLLALSIGILIGQRR